MTAKIPDNGHTLSKIAQKLDDHIENQLTQFAGVDRRLDTIETEMRQIIADAGTKVSSWIKMWIPILVSLLIVGGGWIYGLSRQEQKIAELENGRFENRGNIAVLQKQIQDDLVKTADRDARYDAILEKLNKIERQLERLQAKR